MGEKLAEQAPLYDGPELVREEQAEQAPLYEGPEPVREAPAEQAPFYEGPEPMYEERRGRLGFIFTEGDCEEVLGQAVMAGAAGAVAVGAGVWLFA